MSLLSQADFLKRSEAKEKKQDADIVNKDISSQFNMEKGENLNVFKIPLNQDGKKKGKRHNTNSTETSGAASRLQPLDNNERSASYQYLRNKELRGAAGGGYGNRSSTGGETKRQSMTERFKEQFIPQKPP